MKPLRFGAGLMAAVVMLLCAVLGPATRTDLFVGSLAASVDASALGVTQDDLRAFAEETMAYLRGEKPAWEPRIALFGVPAQESISADFRAHMAEVRAWVDASPWVLCAGALLSALLLLMSRGAGRGAFLAGVYAAVGLIVAVLLWAALDFNGLWLVIHRLFIPGGIFSASDPVMQLFPLGVFFQYIPPVALTAAAHLAALTAAAFLIRKPH